MQVSLQSALSLGVADEREQLMRQGPIPTTLLRMYHTLALHQTEHHTGHSVSSRHNPPRMKCGLDLPYPCSIPGSLPLLALCRGDGKLLQT